MAVSFDTRKSVALLALLAVSRAPRSRVGVAAMLWPDSDESRARSSLRRTLSVTAARVGGALEVSRATVRLHESGVWCDLWEVHRLCALDDAGALAEAVSLHRDDFLAGFSARAGAEFDHWQEVVAEEERQRLSVTLARLVELTAGRGELDAARAYCRRWLALDELHEPAQRALMRVLALSGQRAAAVAQYRSCVRMLERELGVEPLAETTALYEDIRANRLPPAPATVAHVAATREADEGSGAARTERGSLGLIGQEGVVDALCDMQRSVTRGCVAVVSGPAGSGKSSIVGALHARVCGSGATWIEARCHPAEHFLELGCVTDLLRCAFALRPGLTHLLSPTDVAEVSRLLPELAAGHEAPVEPLESPGGQVRFFRSISAVLAAAVGTTSPGVLFIDDVHHADETSARLLAYLVHRLDELPVLIVLTLQPELGLSSELASSLDAAAQAGWLTNLEPRTWRAGEVAEVLAAHGVEGVQPDEILRQTGGLPLLVLAYAESLGPASSRDPGHVTPTHGSSVESWPTEVPLSARQLLVMRMGRLSQTTSQVVTAAAVLGGGCDPDVLRSTSGRSAEEVADALDEALRHGWLVERPPVRGVLPTYDFPYTALERVAYEACGSARRRLLHGRAADVLARAARRPGGEALSASVAAHLDCAGRGAEAAGWAWRAAQRSLSLYAHAEALDNLRRALELGYPAAEAHSAIADALTALGRYREALVELEQAAAAAAAPARSPGGGETASDGMRAAIEHRLAAVHERLGNWPVAAAHIEAALELCGSDPALHARLLADRALLAYRSADPHARDKSEAALAAAEADGDARALTQARNVAGVLASIDGDWHRAEWLLRASLEVAEAVDDHVAAVAALNNLARVLSACGRDHDAIAAADEALRRGVQQGDVHRIAALHSNLADRLHATGRSEESIAHLKESALGFATVDAESESLPRIWTLVDW